MAVLIPIQLANPMTTQFIWAGVVLDEQKGARMIIFRHLNDELKLESGESIIYQLLVPVSGLLDPGTA